MTAHTRATEQNIDQDTVDTLAEVYNNHKLPVSFEEFCQQTVSKHETIGDFDGVTYESTAALVAQELVSETADDTFQSERTAIQELTPADEKVTIAGTVDSLQDVRTFENDSGTGKVLNATVTDETGIASVAFWHDQATAVAETLTEGAQLRLTGYPTDPYFEQHDIELSVTEYTLAANDTQTSVDQSTSPHSPVGATQSPQRQPQSITPLAEVASATAPVSITGTIVSKGTLTQPDNADEPVLNLCLTDGSSHRTVSLWGELAETAAGYELRDSIRLTAVESPGDTTQRRLHTTSETAVSHVQITESPHPHLYTPDVMPIAVAKTQFATDSLSKQPQTIAGRIIDSGQVQQFQTDGHTGQVREIEIADTTGQLTVVCWGEQATQPYESLSTALFFDVIFKCDDDDDDGCPKAHINWTGAVAGPSQDPLQLNSAYFPQPPTAGGPNPHPDSSAEPTQADNASSHPSSAAAQTAQSNPDRSNNQSTPSQSGREAQPRSQDSSQTTEQSRSERAAGSEGELQFPEEPVQSSTATAQHTGNSQERPDYETELTGVVFDSDETKNQLTLQGSDFTDRLTLPLAEGVDCPALGTTVTVRLDAPIDAEPTVVELFPA